MNYHFKLQFIRIGRYFSDQGIHPAVGVILAGAFFLASAVYLQDQFDYGSWFIAMAGASALLKNSNAQRIHFFESIYPKSKLRTIRLAEQIILAFPFACFLMISGAFLPTTLVLVTATISAFHTLADRAQRSVPTPFSKRPFEYIVGFRKTWMVFLLTFVLLFLSWKEQNENLAMAAIVFNALIAMSFGYKPEVAEYIWNHSKSPKQFLFHKMGNAAINAQVLLLPISLIASFLFPEFWMIIASIHTLCTLFIASIVLAKYAAYPNEIGVAQSMLLGLCLWFPPLLLVVLPKFFLDGRKKLTTLLHD